MAKQKKMMTCDGNQAAAHIAYMFSEVAAIYPITPSSTMAEFVDEWAAQKRKNIFGEIVKVEEMQSEGGAVAAMHGALQAGALATTFTASQGLLLMLPNMYKIAGELLPGVFHVSARAIAAQALSIFGDHQDVMAARMTGFAQLCTGSVQEVMDLAAVAHLTALKTRVPFIHFFDGFRTSHEIQKIESLETEDLLPLIDQQALLEFRKRALTPNAPVTRGTAQNGDIYFQSREAANPFYLAVPDMVQEYMDKMAQLTGRQYHLFDYYGAPDAEHVIIAMGSVTEAIREVIDYKQAQGEKVGLLSVHLYRPFSVKHFLGALPKTVKRIAVLDRTKEPGSAGEPLYMDVRTAFFGVENAPLIVGGRYGLSSKDTTPAQIASVYDNLSQALPKNHFTIGIVDDVTFTSLPQHEDLIFNDGTFEAKFYGLGADGTVGANKNSVKIIGDNTDKYCQAYFAYDSKKSGGFTASHLRFGDKPIRSTYLVVTPDFVACHVPAYLHMYDVLKGLKKNGTFLLNSIWEPEDIERHLPNKIKRYLAKNNIRFFTINATSIAQEIGLGNRTNTILQSAFFKIANVIPYELAVEQMKKFIVKSYAKKGDSIVNMNYAAVDRGADVIEIPVKPEWASLGDEPVVRHEDDTDFIYNVVRKVNAQAGDDLPVSAFIGREDGTWDNGTAASEKRGVATFVPQWKADNCIQCNQCAYVCPHATIRPFLLDEAERNTTGVHSLPAIGKGMKEAGITFRIQVDVLDCLGCGNCANVCPGNKNGKALEMLPLETQYDEQKNWDKMVKQVTNKAHLVDILANVKNSQFAQPLFEFSGACAGCGETPYVKLITQLFGDRQMVANATGCSSIYSGSAPSTPYTTNAKGHGPAWANSLFEDNAEFGLGMQIAATTLRERLLHEVERVLDSNNANAELRPLLEEWIEKFHDGVETRRLTDAIVPVLEKDSSDVLAPLRELKDYFLKHSQWIIGGDGWAYDIGFGGLDHVLASGKNVNILVLDTEVYSNTGGQSSKSTPVGAIAKFAAGGKRVRKKDLGLIATTYGYVYVAQIAMGANQAQTLKVLREAEAYDGPSLVIAYSPCISHGLKGGMGNSQMEEKRAVECGYWHLWHYDPTLAEEGKNPFVFDSKEPEWDKFKDFLKNEVRYSSLYKQFPEEAEELANASLDAAQYRYQSYQRLVRTAWSEEEVVAEETK
ncbi:pyruvate:ferredoxin (flavodoxin) oxidoreductase [Porphyromonas circumdentaria]|uniref:Pyruvate-ferredoxin/flavodoxin oxidoreductase n=1 Tax=Porphyromonas circumdentaria TaxID=29524 RepID=A0A1T4NEA3_9PORP|nr:pyruvate:ferredoxin (flavodoxin) oxidoreductase [Porphyromonas circumdentaria]MBB6275642.1 pyruvate-ferredoxin/flavodoxin oxidoreductase [Porphyromonas circumdentaria]SJZ77327.1 pyruvate-ferredoxin/flavodoxin oxidoreductase [Porphyromonas circumdentaria]